MVKISIMVIIIRDLYSVNSLRSFLIWVNGIAFASALVTISSPRLWSGREYRTFIFMSIIMDLVIRYVISNKI